MYNVAFVMKAYLNGDKALLLSWLRKLEETLKYAYFDTISRFT